MKYLNNDQHDKLTQMTSPIFSCIFFLKWTQYITSNLIKVTGNLMSASSIVSPAKKSLFRIYSFLSEVSVKIVSLHQIPDTKKLRKEQKK